MILFLNIWKVIMTVLFITVMFCRIRVHIASEIFITLLWKLSFLCYHHYIDLYNNLVIFHYSCVMDKGLLHKQRNVLLCLLRRKSKKQNCRPSIQHTLLISLLLSGILPLFMAYFPCKYLLHFITGWWYWTSRISSFMNWL